MKRQQLLLLIFTFLHFNFLTYSFVYAQDDLPDIDEWQVMKVDAGSELVLGVAADKDTNGNVNS